MPIFVVVILHEGMDKLGVIVAVATFVSYIMRFISGYLSDRYGIVKPFVVGGYALSAITKPLLGFTESYLGGLRHSNHLSVLAKACVPRPRMS